MVTGNQTEVVKLLLNELIQYFHPWCCKLSFVAGASRKTATMFKVGTMVN